MSDNFHTNQGEDYYDYMSRDGKDENERASYMWRHGEKYKKVWDKSNEQFTWELVKRGPRDLPRAED